MRSLVVAAAFSLAFCSAARAEGMVTCTDFKSSWQSALKKLALSASGPSYVASGEDERVGGVAGIEAVLTCRDEALGHFEMGPTGDAAVLEAAVASALMGLDRSLTREKAGSAANALRTEAEGRKVTATNSWGPYEFTWRPADATNPARFVIDMAEN